jgi:hypothetical protein
MPPAFALSQDQTLRFIQASPCNLRHTATPKRTSKGSSLSPITSQPTPNNQAPSHKTQNQYPKRNISPGADRASLPATHRNKAKHTAKSPAPNHPKIAKHYQLPKKPDAIVKQQKKNQQQNASQRPNSPASSTTPIIGRAKILANPHQPVKPKSPTTSR